MQLSYYGNSKSRTGSGVTRVHVLEIQVTVYNTR